MPTHQPPATWPHSCLVSCDCTPVSYHAPTQLSLAMCLNCSPLSCVYKAVSSYAFTQLPPATSIHSCLLPCVYAAVSCHVQHSPAMYLISCLLPHSRFLPCTYTTVFYHVSTQLSPAICLRKYLSYIYTAVSCHVPIVVSCYVPTQLSSAACPLSCPMQCSYKLSHSICLHNCILT